jgi:four helix bundle protein
MKTHKDLDVWKDSVSFVTDIYRITKKYPKEEQFGLTSQIRRSAVSIPSNIAEGAARKSGNEFKQFLHIAMSSASELDTQLLISNNLNYITGKEYDELSSKLSSISRMLQGLIKSIDK